MKKLYKYVLIGLLSITLTPAEVFSQNIDTNRMNRDINIMENILGELFKSQITSTSNGTIIINEQRFPGRNSTRGTYLPGYGVIFMVSSNANNVYRVSSNSGDANLSFYYNGDGENEDSDVTQESVTARIQEFLRDYGSTIGQLKNDEKVMVIYGSKSNSSNLFYRLSVRGQVDTEEKESLPVISVSASVNDLNDYRSGKLDPNSFNGRMDVATAEDKEYLDLKVMGNIFETALKDDDKDSFRLSGGVDYLMLDNFGALYSLDVRYDEVGRATLLWEATGRLRSLGNNERIAVEQSRTRESDEARAKEYEDRVQELEENVAAAYSKLVSNIKEYIVDYGRTLSSIDSDQFLLLSINIGGRFDNIPGRLDIQIKKSVLEQLDRGSVSRENALDQVVITEY